MDSRTEPATVGPKTTVREVAKLMKERRTTAVCVMESPSTSMGGTAATPRIAGIFTSKDVVLRVIAAGLDAGRCSVVRVMTPHPDTAPPTMTVHDALKKMHNGHYLNLPVIETDGRLIAIVDVLKLTYATLEQMNAMSAEAAGGAEPEGGPMWGRFFESLGHDDNESAVSGSAAHTEQSRNQTRSTSHLMQSPHSELHPNDSASVVDEDDGSVLDAYSRRKGDPPSIIGAQSIAPDDGTYVFKFRTPSGRTHRFQARHDDVEVLREIVSGKLATDPFFTQHKVVDDGDVSPNPTDFLLSYTDADGDSVLVTSNADVTDAVKIARNAGEDRVVLLVQGGKGWEDATAERSAKQAEQVAAAAQEEVKAIEKEATPIPTPPIEHHYAPPQPVHVPEEKVMGIPKDLLLPASIGALAAVILGIFTMSRLSR
ncbi:uncharacterized protein PHACADRAFT_132508 [Phanerochaete carnosa HHB-10118-sp]|uniref:CBS domain-containing protein n=1 Tax=Phanerochaete carnosa (strain HHB-10118-sp) TaxID=650164 RepID=K5VNJ6_PHACS|nr:uncharacterized protein PHACADRAFT_132508 [Phanerochaete carnosa HHB-10118-sp]EKM48265.1 hypothetical protein PHACADRAFT_132508 [Phanerochaete carnosa HHB-10118-sp]